MAGVSAVAAETRHVFPRHTHDQFGIGVIHQGAQKSLSGRGMVEAGPGDAITVNPGEVHDGAPIGDLGRSWRILYFDPEVISAAIDDMSEGKTGSFEFANPVMGDKRIAGRCRALFDAMTKGDEATTSVQREELMLILLATLRPKAIDTSRAVPDAILAAKSMIDDDPARPVTLAELARAAGLSKFQLLRGFFRNTGFTPHAYLMQRRIDRARRLITGQLTLAEAALASGFADQSHMTRIFVRKYGLSPGLYAQAMTGPKRVPLGRQVG
ncbi:AraC family transcriptional regulator [Taklimakanibacter lacteus]|uniref:AraC family transcriptional regulator n=1 Tax=Taklimakanibacter lacteus TaxID=2268456 RepID=UPI0034D50401